MSNIMELTLYVVNTSPRDFVRILDAAPKLEILTLILDPSCPFISYLASGFLQLVSTQLTLALLGVITT